MLHERFHSGWDLRRHWCTVRFGLSTGGDMVDLDLAQIHHLSLLERNDDVLNERDDESTVEVRLSIKV
jgi:hypothetical protein